MRVAIVRTSEGTRVVSCERAEQRSKLLHSMLKRQVPPSPITIPNPHVPRTDFERAMLEINWVACGQSVEFHDLEMEGTGP